MVVTVHDVSFRRFPHFFSWRDRILFATLFHWSLRRASAVITVSDAARRDILHFYPFLTNKVFITYEAADESFTPQCDGEVLEAVCRRYNINRPFVLAVSNLQPRKNLTRLIEAYRLLGQVVEQPPTLVLVGKAGYRSSAFITQVKDLLANGRLVMTGYVPASHVSALYSTASLFVYPSLYEGFGLPVLEAMACGTPVITSNVSSLPEVAGDAAILVNPTDVGAIARAIQAVLSNETLARDLSQRGLKRAQMFSWEQTAQQTWEIYRHVTHDTYPPSLACVNELKAKASNEDKEAWKN